MPDEKGHCHRYRDLVQDGFKKDVVLGKIAKNLVILGEIDEDRDSILGYPLEERWLSISALRCGAVVGWNTYRIVPGEEFEVFHR
jgi:hypothetical protein